MGSPCPRPVAFPVGSCVLFTPCWGLIASIHRALSSVFRDRKEMDRFVFRTVDVAGPEQSDVTFRVRALSWDALKAVLDGAVLLQGISSAAFELPVSCCRLIYLNRVAVDEA